MGSSCARQMAISPASTGCGGPIRSSNADPLQPSAPSDTAGLVHRAPMCPPSHCLAAGIRPNSRRSAAKLTMTGAQPRCQNGGALFASATVPPNSEWGLRSVYGFAPEDFAVALRAFAGLPGVTVEDSGLPADAPWKCRSRPTRGRPSLRAGTGPCPTGGPPTVSPPSS